MMGTPCDVPLPRKMNENDMIKIFFRCRLPAYSIQPRMHTDKHGFEDKHCANDREMHECLSHACQFMKSASGRFYPCPSASIRGFKLYRDEI